MAGAGPSESDLVKSVAAKTAGTNKPQFWVEKGNVRRGPYASGQKAATFQAQRGGELIFQPKNTPGKVGVTDPMYRQSPRTNQTSNQRSLPGVGKVYGYNKGAYIVPDKSSSKGP